MPILARSSLTKSMTRATRASSSCATRHAPLEPASAPLDDDKALYCVHHDYTPANTVKMDGQQQTTYPRKNWSSFMAFNGAHPNVKALTPAVVNAESPAFLHRFTWLEDDIAQARLAASLLLTLPGVPFIYYGEEIGMTGNKPDPRIRTPMHWSLGPAAGFTDGAPWEPLQPDSFTANVEAMNDDPNSLLNHYRRLIHLRAQNSAIGSGELVALEADSEAAVAYLRRADDRVALVVANLGAESLTGVTLSAWINPQVKKRTGFVFDVGHHANDSVTLIYGGGDQIQFSMTSDNGGQFLSASGYPIEQWHHVAAVKARDALRIYVDGQEATRSSRFSAHDYDLNNDRPLRIGFGPFDYFNGLMSDVRLYNRALADDEIHGLALT